MTDQVNAHPKAAFCLEFPDLCAVCNSVPDIDPAVERRARQIAAVCRQRYGPDFAGRVAVFQALVSARAFDIGT